MARYVKVSSICPKLYDIGENKTPEEAVVQVSEMMKKEIGQVLPDKPDIIVLPEVSDLPLHSLTVDMLEYYKVRGDRILNSLSEIAVQNNCYIAYPSVNYSGDGTFLNAVRMIGRNGKVVGEYHKNHPTICEVEKCRILCGKDTPLIQCDFGTVGCAICFDLNFDVLRVKYKALKPDILLFCSAYHGGFVQQAFWAYSIRTYFISSVIGYESAIINPVTEKIARSTNYFNYVTKTINLDYAVAHLDYNRDKIIAMKEKYKEEVDISEPGDIATVLLSSCSEKIDIHTMVKEFDIELLDDYIPRALACHGKPENIER